MIRRRLFEKDLTLPVLYVLSKYGDVDTSALINLLLSILNPVNENLTPLRNRNDTKITQIIRNIVSHRDSEHNIINMGLVHYNEHTRILSLTEAGGQFFDEYIASLILDEIGP